MRFSGERLKEQRLAAGVRRERLAADVDRSLETIKRYEYNMTTPPEAIVNGLAHTLGVSPLAFYDTDPGDLVSA